MKQTFIRLNHNLWHRICFYLFLIQRGIKSDEGRLTLWLAGRKADKGVTSCHRQVKEALFLTSIK